MSKRCHIFPPYLLGQTIPINLPILAGLAAPPSNTSQYFCEGVDNPTPGIHPKGLRVIQIGSKHFKVASKPPEIARISSLSMAEPIFLFFVWFSPDFCCYHGFPCVPSSNIFPILATILGKSPIPYLPRSETIFSTSLSPPPNCCEADTALCASAFPVSGSGPRIS